MLALGHELTFVERDYVIYNQKKYLYFGGTDYHRHTTEPLILEEIKKALNQYGINSTGSRITTGNHPLYQELETAVADFFGTEAACVVSSGYLSPILIFEGLEGLKNRIFLDKDSHSSLLSAVKLSGKPYHFFEHLNQEDLAKKIKKHLRAGELPIVATDGVFAVQGHMPPLGAYEKLLSVYGGSLVIDDSHGMATLGVTGKGSVQEAGIDRKNVFQGGTLSKGIGVFGGVVVNTKDKIDTIKEQSNAFNGASGIPLVLIPAALKSLSLLKENPEKIRLLQERSLSFKKRLVKQGYSHQISTSPIISITHNDEKRNMELKKKLLQAEIYPPFIHYPGSPRGGHFRFAMNSHCKDDEIDRLFSVISASL